MKVTIIGLGFVGLSLACFLANKGIKVIGIDSDVNKAKMIKNSIPPFHEPKLKNYQKKALENGLKIKTEIDESVLKSDFVFVTVGTPTDKNGKIVLKYVNSVIDELGKLMKTKKIILKIVLKSTVIPGTANNLKMRLKKKYNLIEGKHYHLLTNPEFLKEGSAIDDTINPHLIVIGGNKAKITNSLVEFYKKVYPNYKNFLVTNNSNSELIKYANNAFLATKISFINSIANLCQKIEGANIDLIAKAIGTDPRIGNQFLNAGPGYGGSCFPKDVQALINFSKNIGYVPQLLTAVHKTNYLQKDIILEMIEQNLKKLKNKKIVIFGLSFKENTDDVRESVSIKIIKSLLEKNCKITVSDPKAIENTKKIFHDKISYLLDPIKAIPNSDCIVVLTPWKLYANIPQTEFLKMKNPLIIDTRRMLGITNKKINYISLGIGK